MAMLEEAEYLWKYMDYIGCTCYCYDRKEDKTLPSHDRCSSPRYGSLSTCDMCW